MGISANQIAQWCNGRVDGPDKEFTGLELMDLALPTDITFAGHSAYSRKLKDSPAAGAIITDDLPVERRDDQTLIWVKNADLACAQVAEKIAPPLPLPPIGIHPTAVIDPTATIGTNVRIGPQVVIQANAVIGDRSILMAQIFIGADSKIGVDCLFWPQVCIRERCTVGNRVILHPGVVIGSDGFGYRFHAGKYVKIPQIGTVEIGDDCELGANTTIDRGKFSATVMGEGCKLDNLCQIGHNVRLGPHSVMVAHTAIGGTVRTGAYLAMGGGSVISDHLKIGTGVQLAAMSALASDAPDGAKMGGLPARPFRDALAELKVRQKLPKLAETVRMLEQRVASLESTTKNP